MGLSKNDENLEIKYLKYTTDVIREKLSDLGQVLMQKEEEQQAFKRFIWDNKQDLDPQEMRSLVTSSELEAFFLMQKGKYFKNLYKIQNNPYFGSIIFNGETIYIGITYLEDEKKEKHIIYDWRTPICSLFYDYEIGPASYIAPEGSIDGNLTRKRQYKIADGKFVHIFDNSINIDDELLQEVLASESSEKMKNIVNTIQIEQNKIIRNTEDKNLIVQGIAGSGKTSVALHRIAFLLYKIPNLTSNKVLILSPNNIFTEYISNVLPELGEENTMQTTFHDFLLSQISEYNKIESFTDFISRYYTNQEKNIELVKYKQSNRVIDDMDNFVRGFVKGIKFVKGFTENNNPYSKEELNEMLHDKYSKFLLMDRINTMAEKMSENNYNGSRKKVPTYRNLIVNSLNFKPDYKKIFYLFFLSNYCPIELSENEIKSFVNKKNIKYEDASIFVYLKGLLEGFNLNNDIKEIVIDEAQDYSKLQYLLISKIFKKSGFTILGDINQTINPYYKYQSLYELSDIFKGRNRYLELNKTYRSSSEIIEYSNSILGLNHVSAIRRGDSKPVLKREEKKNLKELLLRDINELQKNYKSIAIVTKDNYEADYIYNLLNKDCNVNLINNNTVEFEKELIIIPSYLAKGLEFDAVLAYNKPNSVFGENEKYLYYVACTRAQHQLIVYN